VGVAGYVDTEGKVGNGGVHTELLDDGSPVTVTVAAVEFG